MYFCQQNKERKLRILFQTLVDLREIVNELLEYGYPKWSAIKRDKQDVSERAWRMFFLNVEMLKVRALKMRLINAGMSEDTFIKMVEYFLIQRNIAAHEKLSMMDRHKVFNTFISVYATNKDEKDTILAIMYTYHLGSNANIEYSKKLLNTIEGIY